MANVIKLPESSFKVAEYQRRTIEITMQPGWPMDAIYDPIFWSHVGKNMRARDIIEVWTADNARLVMLRVIECDRLWAKVKKTAEYNFDIGEQEAAEQVPEGYKLVLRGQHKFCVIRIADKEILKEDEPNRASALAWIKNYVRKIAA